MGRLRVRTPSPAMAVACIALAIALSGAGYAAVTLPRNSVGTAQLKRNAVIGSKVKVNSLGGADINEARLGQVPSAANAVNAANATNAGNADTLDTLDSTAFLRSNAAAGGALAGTYPNPTIAPNAVAEANVANGSLRLADIAVWTLAGNIGGATIPANGCQYFNFGAPSGGLVSDLVLPKSDAAVPQQTALSAVFSGANVLGGVCNFGTVAVVLPNPFVMRIHGIR